MLRERIVDMFGIWASVGVMGLFIVLVSMLVIVSVRQHLRPLEMLRWALPTTVVAICYLEWLYEAPIMTAATELGIVILCITGYAYGLERKVPRE